MGSSKEDAAISMNYESDDKIITTAANILMEYNLWIKVFVVFFIIYTLIKIYSIFQQHKLQKTKLLNKQKRLSKKKSNSQMFKKQFKKQANYMRTESKSSPLPFQLNSNRMPVLRICVTGGPCAGKTTAITKCAQDLTEKGFRVFTVPEAATLLNRGGATIANMTITSENVLKFQVTLIKTQMALEDNFVELAMDSKEPVIILCDRGVLDGSAYMSQEEWQALLDETGWSTVQLRDRRYELVMHLVTAADGAEEFYNVESNESRYENLDQAKNTDKKTQMAWVGHPHFVIIDNNPPGFQLKIKKSMDAILKYVGLPSATHFYKKFLMRINPMQIDRVPKLPPYVKVETFEIDEVYLKSDDPTAELKISRRGQKESYTYLQVIRMQDKGEQIEKKRQISSREYMRHLESNDPERKKIRKLRQCFIYQKYYFIIDTFLNCESVPSLLRMEIEDSTTQIEIPPFLNILREVTDEEEYLSYNIAKNEWMMPQKDKLDMIAQYPQY